MTRRDLHEVGGHLPEFEDVFLLLVLGGYVARGLPQADGGLAVVVGSLGGGLAVFVEAQLVVGDDAEHVVPRPANHRAAGSGVAGLEGGGSEVTAVLGLPVGGLFVGGLPLVLAVQETLQLRAGVLVFGG